MGSIAIAFYVQSHAMLVPVLFNAVSFGANESFRDSITQELTSLSFCNCFGTSAAGVTAQI